MESHPFSHVAVVRDVHFVVAHVVSHAGVIPSLSAHGSVQALESLLRGRKRGRECECVVVVCESVREIPAGRVDVRKLGVHKVLVVVLQTLVQNLDRGLETI
jgi:hypothetical protein